VRLRLAEEPVPAFIRSPVTGYPRIVATWSGSENEGHSEGQIRACGSSSGLAAAIVCWRCACSGPLRFSEKPFVT